jgi:hypothetical protein
MPALIVTGMSFAPSSGTLPPNYFCPDMAGVQLAVGERAFIAPEKVNLRSYAYVPSDDAATIVAELLWGTTITIIGGPQCAHDGSRSWTRGVNASGYYVSWGSGVGFRCVIDIAG